MREVLKALLTMLGLVMALSGCDNGAQQNQKNAKTKDGADANTDSGSGDDGDDDNSGDDVGASAGKSGDFAGWCEKAAETDVVKSKLSALFAEMCEDGKPTKLMTSTMISKAFSGNGSPTLTNIEPIEGDKTYSTAFFAVGIKLPIDIETHFTKVGPRAGDEEAQNKLATDQGAKSEFEVKDKYTKDGKYHVRGWKVRSKQTKKISIVNVVTESISRSDQFELEKGSIYLYTQYVLEGIEGVKDFSLLTAGIKTEKGSYLLTTAKVKVNNKGLPDLAKGQITDTAKQLIKQMHKAAADAK